MGPAEDEALCSQRILHTTGDHRMSLESTLLSRACSHACAFWVIRIFSLQETEGPNPHIRRIHADDEIFYNGRGVDQRVGWTLSASYRSQLTR